jgi:hypothetical protein
MTSWIVLAVMCVGVNLAVGDEPVRLFVSPEGNDQWSGRLDRPNAAKTDGPLATIERARDEIRKIKTTKGLPQGGVTVEMLAGRYELCAPVELTADDSGTAESPIEYRARPGDVVHISGGRFIDGWKPVTDAAVLARLDAGARGKVVQTDLKSRGITQYGDI